VEDTINAGRTLHWTPNPQGGLSSEGTHSMSRAVGPLFLVVLLAAAAVAFLQARSAQHSVDAITAIATDLREENVAGQPLDRDAAKRVLSCLQSLVDEPRAIDGRLAELRMFAATAAAWAPA